MKHLFLAAALLISTPAFAWDGFDWDSGTYVEIEDGNLVREGEEIEGQKMTTALSNMDHQKRLFRFCKGRAHRVFDLLFLRAVMKNQDDEKLRVRGEDEEHPVFLGRINERCRQLTVDDDLIDDLLSEFEKD